MKGKDPLSEFRAKYMMNVAQPHEFERMVCDTVWMSLPSKERRNWPYKPRCMVRHLVWSTVRQ